MRTTVGATDVGAASFKKPIRLQSEKPITPRLCEGGVDRCGAVAPCYALCRFNQSNPSRGNTQSCALRLSCFFVFLGCGDCLSDLPTASAFRIKAFSQSFQKASPSWDTAHTLSCFIRFHVCRHKRSVYTDESSGKAVKKHPQSSLRTVANRSLFQNKLGLENASHQNPAFQTLRNNPSDFTSVFKQ